MSLSPANATAGTRRRYLVWVVLGLLLIGVAAIFVRQYAQPAFAVDEAITALARNDPAHARIKLDQVLAKEPNDSRALLLAAEAARRCGDYSDAERFLAAFEAIARPTESSRLEWILLGVQQGDFDANEDSLRSAVGRNHPEEKAILEALARGYAAAFRWSDASSALGRLLSRDTNHVPALLLRAAIADRNRDAKSAEEDLRKAVALAPDNAIAQAALADFLTQHGFTREAIYHYELALHERPGYAPTRLGLARALADAGDQDGAIEQLDQILGADANQPDALLERGRLALRLGKYADADSFLERATRVAPRIKESYRLRLLALQELKRNDTTAKCRVKLEEFARDDALSGRLKLRARDNPADAAVRMELWVWALRNGEQAEGVAWLAEILRRDPQHAAAHLAFADYFEQSGQPRRATLHRSAAGKQ